MIPKKLHYCWLGKNEKPALIKRCIESWKKYLPDFELIEWNEENFDVVNSNEFVKRNYSKKHYANVSDYIRAYAIYTQGGIYLDTDCEIIRNLDDLLCYEAFAGMERDYIANSLFGAVAGHPWMEKILKYYQGITYEIGGNAEIIGPYVSTLAAKEHGFRKENVHQDLNNGVHIYPSEYFTPMNWGDYKITLTRNTYAIHHFNASWVSLDIRCNFLESHIVSLLKTIDDLMVENTHLKESLALITNICDTSRQET
jgi:mannosyltransferase OCH1-like enzyme